MDGQKSLVQHFTASVKSTNNPAGKKAHWRRASLRAFDSQGYALVFEGAACDGVVGSKQTHMGGYVEQRLAQSPNGRPIEEDAHAVKR